MRDVENTPRIDFPPAARRPVGPGGGEGGGLPINERSYRRFAEPFDVVRVLAQTADRPRDEDGPGYVVHLPIRVADLAVATAMAGTIATSLSFLGEVDAGETTVSTADDQNNRHRVFCDLPLPDRSRCPQPYDHGGPCGDVPAAPEQRPVTRSATGP
ncbi:hypothetical protein QTQ03_17525 [Micromonospora sp. WMMA1363]|uniref:hypothetical protein n=1 Tax=Micromonospora sp. WMMA1363 TaxID=3053985 RepID=UPI00259C7628|nr:hypothetical protein [Micromonospora sp. WMMA1363]MDM4721316.1 hypothetical protein [Micromonospora sp. WMMA1363]